MRRILPLALLLAACGDDETGDDIVDPGIDEGNPQVSMVTTLGDIVLEIDVESAPTTGENFMGYVDSGFFDGDDGGGETLFHRVIKDFMIQGGGFKADGALKTPGAPIPLEVDTGLQNLRGTIAMARTNNPDSATTQFFINHVDNGFLDSTGEGTGYAVFGKVVEGMDVLDAIANVAVDDPNSQSPRPLTDVVVTDCERVE